MRLLVIEDEPKAGSYLQKGLGENGFSVDWAENGETGLQMFFENHYDLLILDIMLPLRDGLSVMTEIRAKGLDTPVLFLTAKDQVQDRVNGLEMGADDYLVKPFAFSELLARVRSLLRRSPTRTLEIVRVKDLELDLVRHKAQRNGVRLDLTPKEFALLALLARRQGDVLTRTLIAEQIWDMNFDCGTNVVDVHVRRLRAKVDDPFDTKLIQTVRGVGYVIEDRG